MAVNFTTLTGAKTLDGSIKNYVNRSDIPIINILTEAEALIYTKLRVREMQVREAFTSTDGDTSEALPSGFLDIVALTPYAWSKPLEYLGEHQFVQVMNESGVVQEGTPGSYTILGTSLIWDCALSADFGGHIIYYKTPTELSVSNETNFLTSRYPTLLRYACLVFAYEHMKDEARSLKYRQMVEAACIEISPENELYRRGQR